MKLKDQVCSLESSKRLKGLWVKQESLFYWHLSDGDRWLIYRFGMIAENFSDLEDNDYSAFTVAELREMLPESLRTDWSYARIEAKTEAEVHAKMLIYLLENKLMELSNDHRCPPKKQKPSERIAAIYFLLQRDNRFSEHTNMELKFLALVNYLDEEADK